MSEKDSHQTIDQLENTSEFKFGGKADLEKIVQLLNDDDADVRLIALDSLPNLSEDPQLHGSIRKSIPRVMSLLSDNKEAIRLKAADTLDKLNQSLPTNDSTLASAIAGLIGLFSNRGLIVREMAADSLIMLSEQGYYQMAIRGCIADLKGHMSDGDGGVRKLAASSLIKLSENERYREEIKKFIPHLIKTIGQNQASARDLAADTLISLSKHDGNLEVVKERIPDITHYLSENEAGVRLVATNSLIKLFANVHYQEHIKIALPQVKKLLLDKNMNICRAAAHLLAKFDQPHKLDNLDTPWTSKPNFFPITPYRVRENRHKMACKRRDPRETRPFKPWKKGDYDSWIRSSESTDTQWRRLIHPDGTPYYVYFENMGPQQPEVEPRFLFRAVTECESDREGLVTCAQELYKAYRVEEDRRGKVPGRSYDNFWMYLTRLETGSVPKESHESMKIGYYFIDFDWNQIFWCESNASEVTLLKLPEMKSWEEKLSTRFLQHLGLFPNSYPPKMDIANFLKSSLVMSAALTGIDENIAFKPSLRIDSETCSSILDLLSRLIEGEVGENIEKPKFSETWFDNNGYLNWFLGTVLEDLILNSPFKVYSDNSRPGKLDIPLKYFLYIVSFGIFGMYHSYLQKIWSDRMVTNGEWGLFRDAISSELADTNLLATVLLSANVSFLALSNAPNSAIVFSIVSTLLSIASIASGTHNAIKHRILRSRRFFHPRAVDEYFSAAADMGVHKHDMRLLALFLSLPSALLLWSLANFVSALALYTFTRTWSMAFSLAPAAMLLLVVLLMAFTAVFFWRLFSKSKPNDAERQEH